MKKIFMVLMACTMFIACNNDKGGGKKADYRDKDDYTTTDDKDDDDDKDPDDKQSDDKSKKNDDDQGDVSTNDGWLETDRNKFLTECMGSSGENQEQGKKICPCVLEKLEKKYTSLKEADAKGGEAEGRNMAIACADELNITIGNNKKNNDDNDVDQNDYSNGGWTSSQVKEFVVPCVKEALKSGKMDDLDAQSYCDCMQDKLAKMYPNAKDPRLQTLTSSSPVLQRMAKSCLPGN